MSEKTRSKRLLLRHKFVVGYTKRSGGSWHGDLSRYAETEPLYQRSLVISEKVLRPAHPDMAQSLENYAYLLWKIGRSPEAKELEAGAQAVRAKHTQENPVERGLAMWSLTVTEKPVLKFPLLATARRS